MKIILQSTITCPSCGHKKEETMPTDACQYFYECENCKKVLSPKHGECCVYCSYGSEKCPSVQQEKKSNKWKPTTHLQVPAQEKKKQKIPLCFAKIKSAVTQTDKWTLTRK